MEDRLEIASKFINTTQSHLFLTGKAGTGKTTFLKNLSKITHKSFIVVAPTGIAALNAGGVTIHSQFLIPPSTFLPDRTLNEVQLDSNRPQEKANPYESKNKIRFINQGTLARKYPLNSIRKQIFRNIDLLVIDEVSMLRADLLDAIDYRLRASRGNFRESFGGVQVLFIGDLYQLPPVIKNEEKEIIQKYYKNGWFYEAKCLVENPPIYIELEKIFRQNDPAFIQILNNIRNNVITKEDLTILNQFYKSPDEISTLKQVITLTTHNYSAEAINQKELNQLDSSSSFFNAYIKGDFPEHIYPVEARMELKTGTQIVFIRNDRESQQYYNGLLATIKEIEKEDIWVELAETNRRYKLKRERWENRTYILDKEKNKIEEEVVGTFEQYPIKLAWAITIHKSQGLTFTQAIIDIGKVFAGGQVYVALSRLKSLNGLILRSKINPYGIQTDQDVLNFVQTHHKPDQILEIKKEKQDKFISQIIQSTFDFSILIKEIGFIKNNQKDLEGFGEDSMQPILLQITNSFENELNNTEKFKNQLFNLLIEKSYVKLIERLTKGSTYYQTLLWKNLEILLRHRNEMVQHKRMKTYIGQLEEIDQFIDKKLKEVEKASLLIHAIIMEEDNFNFENLIKDHELKRTSLFQSSPKFTKSKVTQEPKQTQKPKNSTWQPSKGLEKPGNSLTNLSALEDKEEFSNLKLPKDKKSDKIDTKALSLEMFQKGIPIEKIALERNLAITTIEGHLIKALESGILHLQDLVKNEDEESISKIIENLVAPYTSKDVFEKLEGKFRYSQIKAVMVERQKQEIIG